MELYVLLESYVCAYVPEFNLFAGFQVFQHISAEASAAEVGAFADFIVEYIQSPGTWFLPVSFAVAKTYVPSVIIFFSGGGVLYIFTLYTEVANRYIQINAVNSSEVTESVTIVLPG